MCPKCIITFIQTCNNLIPHPFYNLVIYLFDSIGKHSVLIHMYTWFVKSLESVYLINNGLISYLKKFVKKLEWKSFLKVYCLYWLSGKITHLMIN